MPLEPQLVIQRSQEGLRRRGSSGMRVRIQAVAYIETSFYSQIVDPVFRMTAAERLNIMGIDHATLNLAEFNELGSAVE